MSLSSIFSGGCDISIKLTGEEERQKVAIKHKKKTIELLKYVGNETVSGVVHFTIPKRLEHMGITLDFIGQIVMDYDRGNTLDFTALHTEVRPAGVAEKSFDFPFEFPSAEKPHESYNGVNVRVRYFVRVTVSRKYITDIRSERDIWVVNYQKPPEVNLPIALEVGIENCIHIKFEYNKSKFHLRDVVIGKVDFILVRTRIKYMELSLLRKETTGQVPNTYTETECLTKYEIMDGAPVKGEVLPVRLFLRQFDLAPTYRNVANKFSVKYFLNLVLFDAEDRRYFKQQEINLWRRKPKNVQGVETENDDEAIGTTALADYNTKKEKKSKKEVSSDSESSSEEEPKKEETKKEGKKEEEEETKEEEEVEEENQQDDE